MFYLIAENLDLKNIFLNTLTTDIETNFAEETHADLPDY